VNYEKKSSKSLPLKHMPVGVTVIKIGNTLLVDPSAEEWGELDSRLTVATIEDGRICALQKGGDLTLSLEDVEKIVEIAAEKAKVLRGYLK
ncbi:RNA-binding protein, partial [Candidatus Woesearchaeota archaeon]|nr:RNA-binding protein [Candidatus Woesearchaeota archaeon]